MQADDALPAEWRRTHVRLQTLLDDALADADLTPDDARAVLQELGTALEELRVAEEELSTQAEQLAASAIAIDEERERYVELFEFAPDAYLETDEMGKIVEANIAAADLFGVPQRHLRGKLVISFVAPDERRRFRQIVAEAAAGGAAEEVTVTLRSRDERDVVVGATVARQATPSLERSQLRWLLRDITERLKLQSQVAQLSDEVELLERVADVQRIVAQGDPLESSLRRTVELAEGLLPDCQIGLTLVGRSDMERALASGPVAQDLDARQRAAGEGPCIEAIETRKMVRGRPEGWPALVEGAEGVSEIVAAPLVHAEDVAGAVNIYAIDHDLDERDMHIVESVARHASIAVGNAVLFTASRNLAHGLTHALDSRGVIERAKGLLMARDGLDADTAFDVLRRASQRENLKLRDVAARIVGDTPGSTGR